MGGRLPLNNRVGPLKTKQAWAAGGSLATQEAEIKRIAVGGQRRQKARPYLKNTQYKHTHTHTHTHKVRERLPTKDERP
jgi:hypothetical protein